MFEVDKRASQPRSQGRMKTAVPSDTTTTTIPIGVIAEDDNFTELNPEYHYTIAKFKSHATSNFHFCGGFWLVGNAQKNFSLTTEAATRIVNEALSQNYIVAYLHLSTGRTGAVGRKGAMQS